LIKFLFGIPMALSCAKREIYSCEGCTNQARRSLRKHWDDECDVQFGGADIFGDPGISKRKILFIL